jgi:hydrogenase maturation factor
MSFDVYLQDFSDDPADRSESVGRDVLGPLLDHSSESIVTPDGSAAVYGATDAPLTGVMFNHIDRDLAWQVIFDAAVAGDWIIMPIGAPICIVRDEQATSVHDDLKDEGIVLVRSGAELRQAASA